MPRYPQDDLIDFPCSPAWVKHYADRGMTPDYPASFYERQPAPDDDLRRHLAWALMRVAQLEENLTTQDQRIENLTDALAEALEQLKKPPARRSVPLASQKKAPDAPTPIRQPRGIEL